MEAPPVMQQQLCRQGRQRNIGNRQALEREEFFNQVAAGPVSHSEVM
jgi:hypothetical protein